MFRIIAKQAIEECVQLEQCVSLFQAENIETEAIIRELGAFSGMEEVLLRLNGTYNRMQEESRILRQMMQGLDRTIQCCMNCEDRICGNVEESAVQYVQRKIGVNDFSQILDLIEEIHLR